MIGRKDGKRGCLFVVSVDAGSPESHAIGESVGDPHEVCEGAQSRGIQGPPLSVEMYNGRESSRLIQEEGRGDCK